MRKRVTFVLPGVPRGAVGGYKVVYEYANGLAASGCDVSVVHCVDAQFDVPGEPVPTLTAKNRVRRLLNRVTEIPQRPKWFALDSAVTSVSKLRVNAVDIRDSDAVVATSCWTAPFVASLPARCGNKFYFIQHLEDWSAPRDFVMHTWQLQMHRVVISKWLLAEMEKLGLSASYLPNAIDSKVFTSSAPLEDRPVRVCGMVSDIAWKRSDVFVESLIRIKSLVPNAEAVAFGTCSRPKDLPDWASYVRSPSQRTLASEIYGNSRVYLCSSDAEGWHLPPAEALACGAAVVSTRIPGVLEYAEDVAEFAPPGDSVELAERVADVLTRPAAFQVGVDTFHERMRAYSSTDAVKALESVLAS